MVKEVTKPKPACPKCGRIAIYFRNDGSLFCRACGYDSKKEKKP